MCRLFFCENCGEEGCVIHHRCDSVERAGCVLREEEDEGDFLDLPQEYDD
jgi:hypothetical protein